MAKKLINTDVKLGIGTLLPESIFEHIPFTSSSADLLTAFNSMEVGTIQGRYAYTVTRANNWPADVSNNNSVILIKMANNYGIAISICGFNAYIGRCTSSNINWYQV